MSFASGRHVSLFVFDHVSVFSSCHVMKVNDFSVFLALTLSEAFLDPNQAGRDVVAVKLHV